MKRVVPEAAKKRLLNRICKSRRCNNKLVKKAHETWPKFANREYCVPQCWRDESRFHPAFQPPNA